MKQICEVGNFWVSGSNLSCISTVYIQFTLRNMLPNRIMVDFLSWNRTPQKCWGSNLYASLCQKEKREHAPRGAIWIASGDWEKIHDFSRVLVSAQHQALRLGVSPPILGMGGMSESLRIPVEEPWGFVREEILHQLIGSLSHYFQGFIHPGWCRISSINSILGIRWKKFMFERFVWIPSFSTFGGGDCLERAWPPSSCDHFLGPLQIRCSSMIIKKYH